MAEKDLCFKCNEEITIYRNGCQAMDHMYHVECFVCAICNKKLAGGSFYSVDDKPYCEADYLETVEKCNMCNKPIMERILRASGKPYHPHCFTCTSCHGLLDGVPFTVDPNNSIHCIECFHDKFAPRCAICRKPIAPEHGKQETLRVVAMDKSFHVDCYKCEDCGLKLSSRVEGSECYPHDGRLLCKTCNAAHVKKASSS